VQRSWNTGYIPQGSQYRAVVHQCVLYHGNLNITLGS